MPHAFLIFAEWRGEIENETAPWMRDERNSIKNERLRCEKVGT